MSLPTELVEALQVFDGSPASADAAALRVANYIEAKSINLETLCVVLATALHGAWLMGRQSAGRFDGEVQVRYPEDLRAALPPPSPENGETEIKKQQEGSDGDRKV